MIRLSEILVLILGTALLSANSCALENQLALGVTGIGSWHEATPTYLNPGNTIVKVPVKSGILEIKPDAKIAGENWSFRVRPRLRGNLDRVETVSQQQNDSAVLLRWNEASISGSVSDNLGVSHGLQNYQWGPAEALAPSNLIFRETLQQKDLLYDTLGKHITRINYTPVQNVSEVFLFEWSDNSEPAFYAEDRFHKKALLKSEIGWNGYANYAGLVLGWQDQAEDWLGEYLNLEVASGFTFYIDASQKRGSSVWRPKLNPLGITVLDQTQKNSSDLFLNSVVGLRYAFEGGSDLRGEWIYQQEGYRDGEWKSLNSAFASNSTFQLALSAQNFSRYYGNGIPFVSRNLGYFSFRVPDFLSWKDFSFYIRSVISARDYSNAEYLSLEKSVLDHGTVLFSTACAGGAKDSELRGVVGKSINIGYRQSW